MRTFGKTENKGSALIMVLWVVGILSLLVSAFAFDARIEARITSHYRKRRKAEYLAKSGIDVAELLMNKGREMKNKRSEEIEESQWNEPAQRLSEGLAVRGFKHKLGDGEIVIDIVPEPALRNVNLFKQEDWEGVLEVGGIPEDVWPVLIDSALDWIDRDSRERMDGAETENYYSRLEPSYKARNGPLDTVGELLLVRGFTPGIINGGVLGGEPGEEGGTTVSGIGDLLTTYGDGKVNINAASQRVLMTLPDVDEVVAGAIIEEREGWVDEEGEKEDSSFVSVADLFQRIPDLNPSLRRYVTTSSGIYRITSIGNVGGVRRRIWTVVRHQGARLKYLRWKEEEMPMDRTAAKSEDDAEKRG